METGQITCLGQVSSALDAAFELALAGRLAPLDSVLAESQSAGRGQTRRLWLSPPGNIYAALRLPDGPPFNTGASAAAVAFIMAECLNLLGFAVKIKWPNDLVLHGGGMPRKVGGILVEQRGAVIAAGIGLNLAWAPPPEQLRDGGMAAGRLADAGAGSPRCPAPREMWNYLVREGGRWYDIARKNQNFWLPGASNMILWKGRAVRCDDGERSVSGILLGLAPSGGALLKTPEGELEITGGSLYPLNL